MCDSSSEADQRNENFNERQVRLRLCEKQPPPPPPPRSSVFFLCRVVLVLRVVKSQQETITVSPPPSLRPSSSFLWGLGCAGGRDGPSRVHPSILVLGFLLRRLQDLGTGAGALAFNSVHVMKCFKIST